ncbi:pentapeptide repeat-containing protein [Streptomyces misionensis]|uniref:pentapeptide repeat-containing protein n=1 Tax=Streptomyces misionensis TaxID=67331 RepID=UPI003BB038F2
MRQLCLVADSGSPAAAPGSSAGSADFSGADFPEAAFSGTALPEADFPEADFPEADFPEADFPEADFPEAASVSLSVSVPSVDAVTARGSTISSRPGRRFAETIM